MANPSLGEEKAVQLTRTFFWRGLSSSEMSDRLSDDFRATRGSPCKHRLFASLTLRAARNYVRYSATLRSYNRFKGRA